MQAVIDALRRSAAEIEMAGLHAGLMEPEGRTFGKRCEEEIGAQVAADCPRGVLANRLLTHARVPVNAAPAMAYPPVSVALDQLGGSLEELRQALGGTHHGLAIQGPPAFCDGVPTPAQPEPTSGPEALAARILSFRDQVEALRLTVAQQASVVDRLGVV